jgi:hypothetical protein
MGIGTFGSADPVSIFDLLFHMDMIGVFAHLCFIY